MCTLYELLEKRDFKLVEKYILNNPKYINISIEKLFNLAMISLQFPFENEERAIFYLDKIIKKEPYNFDALIIKMYLQNFYYGKMDDIHHVEKHNWNSLYKEAIVLYMMSRMEDSNKEMFLLESINTYPGFVYPYVKLGEINKEKGLCELANDYYSKALNNVKSTTFSIFDPIEKEAFIDEYILGTRISDLNYNMIKDEIIE